MTGLKPVHQLVAGVVLLIVGVAALLVLVLTGHEDQKDTLLTFLGPSIAALIIVGFQQRAHGATTELLDDQNEKLAQIVRQTNGVMDKRIQDNTKKVLDEHLAESTKAALAEILQDHLDDRVR